MMSCNALMKMIVTPRTVLGLQIQGRGLPQLLPGKTGSLDLETLGSFLEPTKLTFGFRVLRWDRILETKCAKKLSELSDSNRFSMVEPAGWQCSRRIVMQL